MEFEASATLHGMRARASQLSGYVEADLKSDGTIVTQPPPAMHVEFGVEQLRSGNALADREIWKLIDSKRFPKILADLRDVEPLPARGRYRAQGDITLSGRSRKYGGDLSIAAADGRLTIDGNLTLDIRDFGLKPPKLLMMKVDPILRATLHVVAESRA